jgi:outer membrane protein assembly factor BamB
VDGVTFPLEVKWERPAAAVGRGLVVSAEVVYHVHDDFGTICAADAKTGDELWRYTPYGQNIEPTPLVANGTVFICPVYHTQKVHAVDALWGTPIWESAETVWRAAGYPLAANGLLYVFAKSGLSVFDQNSGVQVWHANIDAGPGGPLAKTKGRCFAQEKTVIYTLSMPCLVRGCGIIRLPLTRVHTRDRL